MIITTILNRALLDMRFRILRGCLIHNALGAAIVFIIWLALIVLGVQIETIPKIFEILVVWLLIFPFVSRRLVN
jgi:hypothetical protein